MATHHNSLLEPVPAVFRPQIEDALEDILRSTPFRTSRQCQDLFRYIVEHSLTGREDSLRERVIGIEVFGRVADYDTAEDPVVRLRAADVRKRLAQYYQAQKGEPTHWKIEVPTGSYRALFRPCDVAPPPIPAQPALVAPSLEVIPPKAEAPVVSSARNQNRRLGWVYALVAGCVVAAFAGLLLTRGSYRPATPFDLFWAPVLENSSPVLVCTGSNRVYRLSERARARYRKDHPHPADSTPNLEVLIGQEELKNLTGEDFFPVTDTYLTVGDASATAQISSLLTSHHHRYDLRFGSDLSFGDLREGSAVLIGAFNNSWTLNMTDSLRFVFAQGDSAQMHIEDKFDASRAWWPRLSDGKFVEDYAIVSRIVESKTGRALVTIAGLGHGGTHAAGDFVTNPQRIADLIKQAPKNWNGSNMQVVLHTNIVNNVPGPPTVVATYYW
jgi:hypothetical protein